MKKYRFLSLLLLLVLLLTPSALALEDPAPEATAALLIDADHEMVLYDLNAHEKRYPASITKIMTALLVLEAVDRGELALTDVITAPQGIYYGITAGASTQNIKSGEEMTLLDLLYCTLVPSANEACNVLAHAVSDSIDAFVEQMNLRAAELGMTGTHYANTHGLHDDNHYTTARDFSLIALEASRHDLFMKLCSTPNITIPATNLSGERALKNSNALLCADSIYGSQYLYEYADGMKTGHTNAAGYCLISTADKDGINLLAAVFGGAETWPGPIAEYSNFSDSIKLYEWVFNNFSYREVLRSTDAVTSVDVEMGSNADSVNLRPESSISALLPNDSDFSEFTLSVSYDHDAEGETLMAPIAAGEKLGEVTLSKNGVNYGTVDLVAASGVDLSRGEYIKAKINDTLESKTFKIILWSVIILLVAYIALVVVYRVRRIRHRKAMRRARLERARQQRLEQEEAQLREAEQPRSVPTRPAVSYFKEVEVTEVKQKTPDQARKEQAERDYFEEFFKNN